MGPMTDRPFHLAIETSGRVGSIALGRDDALLGRVELTQTRRHNVELMPAIDAICRTHDARPADLAVVSVSLGPGSFTGLRVGVTAAKMLAFATGCRLVGVPTLDVLARNVPPPHDAALVGLNLKQETVYGGWFMRAADHWRACGEPRLATLDDLLDDAPPAHAPALLGDPLPGFDATRHARLTRLPGELALARAEHVWRIGLQLAAEQRFADPLTLAPLYVRLPDAVERRRAPR